MQTLIAYRFVVSLALSLVVGLVGLHVRPFPADNVLLELIQARQPSLYASLNYTYATLWFSTPFLAISGVCAWLYIFVARTGRRQRLQALPPYSALYVLVSVWNSAMASIPSEVPETLAPEPRCHQSCRFSPSSRMAWPSGRAPEMENVAARPTRALLPPAG